MRKCSYAIVAAMVLGYFSEFASAANPSTLSASQILRVTFTTSANPNPVPDTLAIDLGLIQASAPFTTISASLYNSDTLLGTSASSTFGSVSGQFTLNPSNSWRSSASVWNFDNPAIVDFTSLANGSINGRIDVTIATNAISFDLDNLFLDMGHAENFNTTQLTQALPVIVSAQVVPEPLTMTLLAALALGTRSGRGEHTEWKRR